MVLILFAAILIMGIGLVVSALSHRGDDGSGDQTYPSCVALDDRPGTDPDTTCMNGGDLMTYRHYAGR